MPMRFDAVGDKPAKELYLNFIWEPLRDEAGAVKGIFVEGYDVTAPVRAQRQTGAPHADGQRARAQRGQRTRLDLLAAPAARQAA